MCSASRASRCARKSFEQPLNTKPPASVLSIRQFDIDCAGWNGSSSAQSLELAVAAATSQLTAEAAVASHPVEYFPTSASGSSSAEVSTKHTHKHKHKHKNKAKTAKNQGASSASASASASHSDGTSSPPLTVPEEGSLAQDASSSAAASTVSSEAEDASEAAADLPTDTSSVSK